MRTPQKVRIGSCVPPCVRDYSVHNSDLICYSVAGGPGAGGVYVGLGQGLFERFSHPANQERLYEHHLFLPLVSPARTALGSCR